MFCFVVAILLWSLFFVTIIIALGIVVVLGLFWHVICTEVDATPRHSRHMAEEASLHPCGTLSPLTYCYSHQEDHDG